MAGGGTYIDGFAGRGRADIEGEDRPGSAALAIESRAFKSLLLYELPKTAKALATYIEQNHKKAASRCLVRPGDCNRRIPEDLEAGLVPKDKPCFAFLDPNSTQLSWDTVVALAHYKAGGAPPRECKVELWILFNTHQALMRLMPRNPGPDYPTSPQAATLDRVMGAREAWWDLYQAEAGAGLYAGRYAQRLEQELGYGAARTQRILDPHTKAPQYYMIHASDHLAAHKFMYWAENATARDRSEAVRLPGIGVP